MLFLFRSKQRFEGCGFESAYSCTEVNFKHATGLHLKIEIGLEFRIMNHLGTQIIFVRAYKVSRVNAHRTWHHNTRIIISVYVNERPIAWHWPYGYGI